MRSLLDEVTAEDALPWPQAIEERKPIGIFPLFNEKESIPRNSARHFEPRLYTLFPDNCPLTCECGGKFMPGHRFTNMIDGDTLVDRPPASPPPTTGKSQEKHEPVPVKVKVETILYYDVPSEIRKCTKDADEANKALTKLEKTKVERGSKSGAKRNKMRAPESIRVKEELDEPVIQYVQAKRPARRYIPVQTLLGPFDFEAMQPAPPKAQIIPISPSTAAATLPTPPMSTTSTADGAFSEAQAASTSGSMTSPNVSTGLELQLASPESEPMLIDPPHEVDKPEPPSSAMNVSPPMDAAGQFANSEAGLLPPIDMENLPELSSPAISVQNPLPFGYQPARHWDVPLARPGPEHAETSASGSSTAGVWQPSQGNRQGHQIITFGGGEVRSIGIQRPAGRYPPFHSNALHVVPEYGLWRQPQQQQHNYPPSEALNFPLSLDNTPMMASPASCPPHLPLPPSSSNAAPAPSGEQQISGAKISRTRPQPPMLIPAGSKAQRDQWTSITNGLPSPSKSPTKARSKSSSNDASELDFGPHQAQTAQGPFPTKQKPKTMETSPSSDADTKDKKAKKRFQCAVKGCPATFTRRNDVDRHMKSASAHRDYAQEWASMQSNQGPALNPFRCEKCNRILSRADSAKRHMESGACGKRELPSEQVIGGRRDTPRREALCEF